MVWLYAHVSRVQVEDDSSLHLDVERPLGSGHRRVDMP